jgi:NitT/TauT family transport system permease protein
MKSDTTAISPISSPTMATRSRQWQTTRMLISRIGQPVGAAALVLIAWEVLVRVYGIRPVILPPPSAIISATFMQWHTLLENAIPTALESLGGFLLSVIAGGLLGILLTFSKIARDALYPNVVLFQLIPKVAVAPLFMLWLGIDWHSRVAIAFFVAFFPIVISTVSGLNSVDHTLLRLCKSLTATEQQIFFKVRLPSSLPFLFNGMKISMTLAIIGVIVGEFVTSQRGLGYIILFAGSRLETALVLAAILVLCIVGLLLYGLVALAERIIMKKYGS